MVKVFTTNQNEKIEFTKEELETLLNEVWNDGYNHHGTYYWSSPHYIPYSPTYGNGSSITCDSDVSK